MNLDLSFLPEIEGDVFTGFLWYENKAVGLGDNFLQLFYACASKLSYNALLYQKVYNNFRRCLMKKFPYAIYYRIEMNKIIVVGVFHTARNPQTVKSHLLSRKLI